MVGAAGEFAVDGDQILHAAHLAAEDDLLAGQAQSLSEFGGFQRGSDQRLVHDLFGIPGGSARSVLVHQAGQQFLVQAAPVHAYAYRFVVANGGFNHLGKLFVVLVAFAHVAGVDAVFGQGLGAVGKLGQQPVAVVMKVANEWHMHAHFV